MLTAFFGCSIDRTIDVIDEDDQRLLDEFLELPEKSKVIIADDDEPGESLMICLTLINKENLAPLKNQDIYFYHTSAEGEYQPSDPSDESTARLNGEATTDPDGRVFVKTILPGDYGSSADNRHIHTTIFGARPEGYDIHFKQYTGMMGKRFIRRSDQHFLSDLKRNSQGELVSFLTIEAKFE